jgi:hypothetical protein
MKSYFFIISQYWLAANSIKQLATANPHTSKINEPAEDFYNYCLLEEKRKGDGGIKKYSLRPLFTFSPPPNSLVSIVCESGFILL